MFRRATNFDTFLLEYEDDRSGGFEPLADLGEEAVVALGLVTTKRATWRTPTSSCPRRRGGPLPARDRLAISTQCGFASVIGGNPVTAGDQRRKLQLVRQIADRAWS